MATCRPLRGTGCSPKPAPAVSLARGNTAKDPAVTPEQEATARLAAMPDGEPKWKAEYAASAALQGEYGEEKYYLAYQRNKHLCSTYHPSEARKDA